MTHSFQSFRVVLLFALLLLVNNAHAQRNLKDIPDPDPELERKTFVLPDGFEANLYAGDPQMAKPIQMNFDAEGRLWIASSETYPHIKPGEEARDKILVLEDTDQDGKVDKTTVFADNLLIPTGVLPGDGGCYVANSTDLLFLKDTDGDGKADERRVVLSGFGTEDTHHLLHTLRWGVEGSIYMNQSIYIHSHVETPHGVKRLNGGGIWRFRPETMELDIFCRGFVNPWGHHQDRFGQSFATDGAYGEGINYVFPGAIFVTAPGEKRRLKGLNPGSPKHCGLEILSGRHIPPEWVGNMVTNDFRAHRVCRFVVTEDGSGYASRQAEELIKSSHVAFRPIDVKMGPDGAIYIADWYNPIIQHGEVDFRDERRDHVHGRIWRVTAKDRPLVKPRKIVGAPIEELLDMLTAPEDWVRLWAKQELKTRDHEEVYETLAKWIDESSRDWAFFDQVMLEIEWLYQTMNSAGDEPPQHLLDSPVHNIRAAGVRIASDWSLVEEPWIDTFAAAVRDKHPRVRLEGVRALARIPSAESAELAAEALDQPMDRFLDFALWQTLRDLQSHWLPALQKGEIDFGGNVEHLTFALKAVDSPQIAPLLLARFKKEEVEAEQANSSIELIAALGKPEEVFELFTYIASTDTELEPAARARLLRTLVDATRRRGLIVKGNMAPLSELLKIDNDALQAEVFRAAGAWKLQSMQGNAKQAAVGVEGGSKLVQRAGLEAMAMYGDEESRNVLLGVSVEDKDPDIRAFAIGQLANVGVADAAKAAVSFLEGLPKHSGAQPIVASIVSIKGGSAALAKQLEGRKIEPDVAKYALRAARAAPGDTTKLQGALRTAGGLGEGPKKYSAGEIAALVADVKTKGNPHRGEAIYRRKELQCTNCHAIGGSGGKVGPDMISIGASAQLDYLLESLVDPNAKVKENFHSIIVETEAGKIHSGIPVQRTEKQLVLRDQNDQEVTIAIEDIFEEREGRSLMPEGLVEPLTRDELVDLTAFLSQLGKEGDFAVGKEPVVRTWRKLIYTPEGHRRLNRTSHDTAASDDEALVWEPVYSKVSGDLPVNDELHAFEIHRGHPPASFVRFEVEVTTAGDVTLAFGETNGLTLWVDGKPAKVSPETVIPLSTGKHTFTLAIDRQKRQQPLRVGLVNTAETSAKASFIGGK